MSARARSWAPLLALGAILAGAAVLRFVNLAATPGGLYTDEATEAVSALRLLHDPGYHPVFFPDGGGREALFAYLVAGAFHVFGATTVVLRGTAAAIGVLGVAATWWFARRFGTGAALAAAAWMAGTLWLVCISRDGMRVILVPLLEALALTALLAWERKPGWPTAALAGSVVSVASLYTYQPLKLLPLLVVLWLAWLARTDATAWRRLRPTLVPATLAFLVVGAPMLVVAVTDPGAYFGRAVGVSILNPGVHVDLVNHVLRTLGMFALTGDPNPRHDVGGLPMLGWPLTVVAAAGLVRAWRFRADPAHALVGLALPVFLVPPLIALEGGSPHFLRSLGLAVPLAILVGLGALELIDLAGRRVGRAGVRVVALATVVVLVLTGLASGATYMSRSPTDHYAAYRYDLVALADAAGPDDAVVLDDYDASVVRFLDTARLPSVVAPGTVIPNPKRYALILATTRQDLATAIGADAAAGATVLARAPDGSPTVWCAAP